MRYKKMNQSASFPERAVCWLPEVILLLILSSTGKSYVCQGNKFPLCSAPLSFIPMAESTVQF